MSYEVLKLIHKSYDTEIKFSHDCWGSTTSNEYTVLNEENLAKNLVMECLNVINTQLGSCEMSERQTLHELKNKLMIHFCVFDFN